MVTFCEEQTLGDPNSCLIQHSGHFSLFSCSMHSHELTKVGSADVLYIINKLNVPLDDYDQCILKLAAVTGTVIY